MPEGLGLCPAGSKCDLTGPWGMPVGTGGSMAAEVASKQVGWSMTYGAWSTEQGPCRRGLLELVR